MKRIEEFTAEEVWEAIDRDSGVADDTIQVALDYIKANLDTGFYPDWPNAPRWADLFVLQWQDSDMIRASMIAYTKRPSPRMRQKTPRELYKELLRHHSGANPPIGDSYLASEKIALALLDGVSIHDQCRAASIPIETQE